MLMTYGELSREELAEVVSQLEDELEQKEQELAELETTAKRVKADFENYKKKQDERKQRWRKKAEKDLAKDLIRVLDNLERAMMSANEDSNLLKGVEMVADELFNTLKERGLERITPDGDIFDPRIHNAVATQPADEENKVLETQRPGYLYGDDVLREAAVVVGKAEKDTESNDDMNTADDTTEHETERTAGDGR